MFAKGFTLTELLFAVVLMALVMLTATSVSITSHYFFGVASAQAQVQDEAKIVMEHMVNNFTRAHEIYDFGALQSDPLTIGVRLDIDPITRWPNSTSGDSSDDTWIVYRYVAPGGPQPTGEIWYYPNAASVGPPEDASWASWLGTPVEVLVTHIIVPPGGAIFTVSNNRIDIDIRTQTEDADYSANLLTSVVLRSMSAN